MHTTPQCDRFFQASPFDPTGNLKDEDRSNLPGSAEDSTPAVQGLDEEPTTVTLPKPAPRPPPKPKGGTKPRPAKPKPTGKPIGGPTTRSQTRQAAHLAKMDTAQAEREKAFDQYVGICEQFNDWAHQLAAHVHERMDLNQRYIVDNADMDDTVADINSDHDIATHSEETEPIEVTPPVEQKKSKVDYEKLRKYFLFAPLEKVRRTIENTTQFARNIMAGIHLGQTHKSPMPAYNVPRRNEGVATDQIYGKVPAVDDGSIYAQLFIGRSSLVADAFGMKSGTQFVSTLLDVIRKRGAMDLLISDGALNQVCERVQDVLRAFCINDWQSEAYYQHQNFAEHR